MDLKEAVRQSARFPASWQRGCWLKHCGSAMEPAARSRVAGFVETFSRGEGGVGNHGLFATHYLRTVLPEGPEWTPANERAAHWMHLRGRSLIDALGFSVKAVGTTTMLLAPKDAPTRRRAIAVLLDDDERFEGRSARFRVSPVALGLRVAQEHELPWLVALRKSQIRLYSAPAGRWRGEPRSGRDVF